MMTQVRNGESLKKPQTNSLQMSHEHYLMYLLCLK